VERFILKLTLDPAVEEFGLDEVRLIDPTYGSGHFLLGAYDRLFDLRVAREPGLDLAPPTSDEFSSEDDGLSWESEGWENVDASR
jgi:hypothetical protein